jgi:hypothetical protein
LTRKLSVSLRFLVRRSTVEYFNMSRQACKKIHEGLKSLPYLRFNRDDALYRPGPLEYILLCSKKWRGEIKYDLDVL